MATEVINMTDKKMSDDIVINEDILFASDKILWALLLSIAISIPHRGERPSFFIQTYLNYYSPTKD